jgi:mannose/fructose/N-acetylgalactosamine-specific phosphotransferase system component IIC
VQAGGWHAAQAPLIGMGIVGLAAAIIFFVLMQKKTANASKNQNTSAK